MNRIQQYHWLHKESTFFIWIVRYLPRGPLTNDNDNDDDDNDDGDSDDDDDIFK